MLLNLRKKQTSLLNLPFSAVASIVFCLTPATMAQSAYSLLVSPQHATSRLGTTLSMLPVVRELASFPMVFFAISFFLLWFATKIGTSIARKRGGLSAGGREDFGLISSASLTLLGLLVGFTFSMAITRYDLRKSDEEAEANAIGTEYIRADMLSDADAAKVHLLLKQYLDQRVLFYTLHRGEQLQQVNAETTRLQNQLWSAVKTPAAAQPNALMTLVVSGMNDVLNSQGYTQAAWLNRIPVAAWILMAIISILCNMLIGYGMHGPNAEPRLLLILPLVVAVALFLIAEIDSPRGGTIRVSPENLVSLSQSLQSN
jgi:hypothetical protein